MCTEYTRVISPIEKKHRNDRNLNRNYTDRINFLAFTCQNIDKETIEKHDKLNEEIVIPGPYRFNQFIGR